MPGTRRPTFTTCQFTLDDEPRCLVLEDQHEHFNRTRNSCSRLAKSIIIPNHETQCLNVTTSYLTCHLNLFPQVNTNFASITNCKSFFFISQCLEYCAKSHNCKCSSLLSQGLTSSTSSKSLVLTYCSSSKSQSLTPCSNTKSAVLMPYCSRGLCNICHIVQVPNIQVYQTVQEICHMFYHIAQVLNLYICHTVQVICHMFYHIVQVVNL